MFVRCRLGGWNEGAAFGVETEYRVLAGKLLAHFQEAKKDIVIQMSLNDRQINTVSRVVTAAGRPMISVSESSSDVVVEAIVAPRMPTSEVHYLMGGNDGLAGWTFVGLLDSVHSVNPDKVGSWIMFSLVILFICLVIFNVATLIMVIAVMVIVVMAIMVIIDMTVVVVFTTMSRWISASVAVVHLLEFFMRAALVLAMRRVNGRLRKVWRCNMGIHASHLCVLGCHYWRL